MQAGFAARRGRSCRGGSCDTAANFKPGLAALKEIGYDDFMAFECGVPGDPFEEFPQAMDYIRGEWEQA